MDRIGAHSHIRGNIYRLTLRSRTWWLIRTT